jgi:hypothetical protein
MGRVYRLSGRLTGSIDSKSGGRPSALTRSAALSRSGARPALKRFCFSNPGAGLFASVEFAAVSGGEAGGEMLVELFQLLGRPGFVLIEEVEGAGDDFGGFAAGCYLGSLLDLRWMRCSVAGSRVTAIVGEYAQGQLVVCLSN